MIQNLTSALQKKIDKSSWQTYRFDELVHNIVEKVSPRESGLEKYIGLEHLDSGSLKIRRFGSTQAIKGDKLKIYKGDLIFAKRNSYLKRVAIADEDAVASAHSLVLRAKVENVNPSFLPFFLLSESFWSRAIQISVGSLSPTINWKVLARQEFLLPPIDQQAELAELLWAMDQVTESYWNNKTSLENYKKRIAYDCYYNESAKILNLEEVVVKIQDGSHFSPKVIYSENDGTKYRYVTSKNIRTTGIEFKEDQYVDTAFHDTIYPRCNVKKGDVLLTKDGANTGTATLNSLEEEFSLLSSVCLIRANEKTTNEYLCHYLNSEIGNSNLVNLMTGTAITRLTLTTLRKIKIPMPPIEYQQEVVNKLNRLSCGISKSIQSMENSQTLQKSIINQIF